MSSTSCLAVMYHYVRDAGSTPFPSLRALPPALFEQQLDWLQRAHTLIGLDDLAAALDHGRPLPPDAALLTFDDGFVDHYTTVLPVLRDRGLTGVFFLAHDACAASPRVLPVHKTQLLLARLGSEAFAAAVRDELAVGQAGAEVAALAMSHARGTERTAAVFGADAWEQASERALKDLLNYHLPYAEADRVLDALFARHIGDETAIARQLYVSRAMIVEMAAAGMAFGFHTRSHRMLSRLSPGEQESELAGGVAWIRELTGQAHVSFCYPWGGPGTYTPETLELLRRLGYSLAFNTVRRRIDLGIDDRFELPRIDTRDLPPYTQSEAPPARVANPTTASNL